MSKYIIILLILFSSQQVIGENNDSTSYFKRMIKQNYTELDSQFQSKVVNNNWKLKFTYERSFLFFRKFESVSDTYNLYFSNNDVCVKYGRDIANLKSYTVNCVFDDITPELLLFKLDIRERFLYQILRFEDKYMIVNVYYLNKKGKIQNAHQRLIFEQI